MSDVMDAGRLEDSRTGRRAPRRVLVALLGVCGLLLSAAATVVLTYPPLAAAACPTCYGLRSAGANLFVEQAGAGDEDRAAAVIVAARARVRRFYGRLDSRPRILMCLTDRCYRRIGGGGSSGMALMDFALLLSPRGGTVVIAAHELSHIELHRRMGRIGVLRRTIPQWFDEGLAALVSDDPRYLKPVGALDRCLISSAETLPTRRGAWVISARNGQLYAKAACRVWRWVSANGGPEAVPILVDQINSGERFDRLVR